MAIRNTNLGGVDFTSTTEATYTDFNDTFDAVYSKSGELPLIQTGLNMIRQTIDRDIPISAGQIDSFAEAYIDTDGRKNTVTVAGSTDATFDVDKYKTTSSAVSYIKHTIPTGLFPSDVNTVIGVPFYEDFETGASVQYKIYNGTTDTGYVDVNEMHNITAFTEMPRYIMVKLIPTGSPTAGYPSINGFFVNARNI